MKTHSKILSSLVVLGTTITLLVSGCSSTPPQKPTSTSSQQVQPPSQSQPPSQPPVQPPTQVEPSQPPPETETVTPQSVTFGSSVTFPGNVVVTVSKPVPVSPPEGGGPPGMTKFYKVPVKVYNGGSTPFDPSGMLVGMTTGSTEGQWYVDYNDPGSGLGPTNMIPSGHSVKSLWKFGGSSETPLVVTVTLTGSISDQIVWHG